VGKTPAAPRLLFDRVLFVGDAPVAVAPDMLAPSELEGCKAFEIRLGLRRLATLSLHKAPHARFDNEGGFDGAEPLLWDGAAEMELNERLNALLRPESPGTGPAKPSNG
jgi:hypothetical protein